MERLTSGELLKLKRMNTPTIYNGWEQITKHDIRSCFNKEETVDFMPQMGPMIGYAVTVKFEPSNPAHVNGDAWTRYREYVASIPSPKIVIVQDLDKPATYGAFWGEVNSSVHMALGCVGTIVDGAIRDVDEMVSVGFKALARRMCVAHCFSIPVEWNCPVDVFGCRINPGQLIHADKHGFFVIPPEDEKNLLEAAVFMDNNECSTLIPAAKGSVGKSMTETLADIGRAGNEFDKNVRMKYGNKGEWQ